MGKIHEHTIHRMIQKWPQIYEKNIQTVLIREVQITLRYYSPYTTLENFLNMRTHSVGEAGKAEYF